MKLYQVSRPSISEFTCAVWMEKHAWQWQSQIWILDLNLYMQSWFLFLIQRLYSFMCISPHLYSGVVLLCFWQGKLIPNLPGVLLVRDNMLMFSSSSMPLILVMLQVLLLSIMRMSVMVKKQFAHLTIFHLVMTSDDCLWSGLGYGSIFMIMISFYFLILMRSWV